MTTYALLKSPLLSALKVDNTALSIPFATAKEHVVALKKRKGIIAGHEASWEAFYYTPPEISAHSNGCTQLGSPPEFREIFKVRKISPNSVEIEAVRYRVSIFLVFSFSSSS